MTLGPRVIKTGIAVTLALYICSVFQLESAVFAGIAAIFTIQPSIYRTWKQVGQQVQTNILGAIVALIALQLLGNDPLSIGLVMIIVILISLKLKMAETISLTLVTVLAIMSAPVGEDWIFALNRFTVTFIGMMAALLVNIFLFPPNYRKNYLNLVQGIFLNMSILMRTAISNEMTEKSFQGQMKQLEQDILKLEELYKLFDEEREKLSKLKNLDLREIVVFKQMLKTSQQGFNVLENIQTFYFQNHPTEDINELFDEQLEQIIKFHELFLMKFEGKIKSDGIEDHIIKQTNEFMDQILSTQQHHLPLTIVAASIYNYAYQTSRLNRVIEQYIKK